MHCQALLVQIHYTTYLQPPLLRNHLHATTCGIMSLVNQILLHLRHQSLRSPTLQCPTFITIIPTSAILLSLLVLDTQEPLKLSLVLSIRSIFNVPYITKNPRNKPGSETSHAAHTTGTIAMICTGMSSIVIIAMMILTMLMTLIMTMIAVMMLMLSTTIGTMLKM